jgi:hypothetical protein
MFTRIVDTARDRPALRRAPTEASPRWAVIDRILTHLRTRASIAADVTPAPRRRGSRGGDHAAYSTDSD